MFLPFTKAKSSNGARDRKKKELKLRGGIKLKPKGPTEQKPKHERLSLHHCHLNIGSGPLGQG